MQKKLSIIIPVHNCAKGIRKTVGHLLNQDYENLELILVENGSDDNTYEICASIAKADKRCIVVHNSVKSTLMARKSGIDLASGDYITFCDADDSYIRHDSLRKMVEATEYTNADIAVFGNVINRFGIKKQVLRFDVESVITRETLLCDEIAGVMGAYNQKINTYAWGKIYRSTVLKSISSELNLPLIYAEDLYLNCCAFFCEETQTIALIPLCEYVYNSGIGVSGDGILSTEKMFNEYQYFKIKALELAEKYGANEHAIYLCHRETLRFLDCLIQLYIERGDSKSSVCKRVMCYWKYDFVKRAKRYFIDYSLENELDEEMLIFATANDSLRYYDYCINRMGNITMRRGRFRVKSALKRVLRTFN